MISLNPGEQFIIFRGLSDHSDNTTYYAQAVVKDARTSQVLATLPLTDQGDKQFSRSWQVPMDVSGQGFYIVIITSVYTDEACTIKAPNYGDEFDTYLVFDRRNPWMMGGSDIDYKRITKLIKQEINNIKLPAAQIIDIPAILDALSKMQKSVDNWKALGGVQQKILECCENMMSGMEMAKSDGQMMAEEHKGRMGKHTEMVMGALTDLNDGLDELRSTILDNFDHREEHSKLLDTVVSQLALLVKTANLAKPGFDFLASCKRALLKDTKDDKPTEIPEEKPNKRPMMH